VTVGPLRPLSAAEAALRVETSPNATQVIRTDGAAASGRARQALAGEVATPPRTPPASPNPPQTLEAVQAQALSRAAKAAVTRQGGLAPLLADLKQALTSPELPAQLRTAITQLLAARAPLGPGATGPEVKAAVQRSGLFLEAKLAAIATAPGRAAAVALAPTVAPQADAKAALLVARQVLARLTSLEPRPPEAPGPVAIAPRPGPPYREGPIAGQAAAAPSLPPDAPVMTVAHRLMQETTSALARQELMQIASLPDPRQAQALEADGPRWMFEVPVQTGRGEAVAQFEISRDGGGSGGGGEAPAPTWRARFSLDVEPFGPVHVHVSLARGRTSVNLWAESAEGLRSLQQESSLLAATLRAAEITAEVAVHPGAPPVRPAAAGHFVDQAS
jgi:hypothetical protein